MKTTLTRLTALGIFLFTAITQSIAQSSGTSEQSLQKLPLEQLIGPDGTLIPPKNFTGTVDLTGYTLTTNRVNGAPIILRKQYPGPPGTPSVQANVPDDVYWDDRFGGLPGTDGGVNQIAFDSNGDVYICGQFTTVGNITANSIARWDGVKWSALGNGLHGLNWANATRIVVKNGVVYVAGDFTMAGDVMASHIAKWDGVNWSALGTPTSNGVTSPLDQSNTISSLLIFGNDLYVGGSFKALAGTTLNGLAKWNGSQWTPIGRDTNAPSIYVAAMTTIGNDLYIGGSFTEVGNVSAAYIARWDGNVWSGLGIGMDSYVYSLVTSGNRLYAGGNFITAGGVQANGIAIWDGNGWSAMGSTIKGVIRDTTRGTVTSITTWGDSLIVRGNFTKAGTLNVPGIVMWNGNDWKSFDSMGLLSTGNDSSMYGTKPSINTLAIRGSMIYIGGRFALVDGKPACNIAQRNNNQWSALASGSLGGLNGEVHTIAVRNGNVYVGGMFSVAGDIRANCIARWDGSSWHSLGDGVRHNLYNPQVNALAFIGDDLYVGGQFTSAGGVATQGIAKWDGSTWSAVGTSGVGGYVMALAVSPQNELYISGGFDYAGDSLVHGITKWNGSTFAPLGNFPKAGVSWNFNGITTMVFKGDTLYLAGSISRAGDIAVSNIASWDGKKFASVGGGVYAGSVHNGVLFSAFVEALAVGCNGDLYVGGSFLAPGGIENLAVWNGSEYKPVGGRKWGYDAYSLSTIGNDLYVGGSISKEWGDSANGIVRWNGSVWEELGSGIGDGRGNIYVMQPFGNDLYCGGGFPAAGNKSSVNLARWTKGLSAVREPSIVSGTGSINAQPNPARESVTIIIGTNSSNIPVVEIFDPLGRKISTLSGHSSGTGSQQLSWNVSDVPNGIYTCRAVVANTVMVRKIAVRH